MEKFEAALRRVRERTPLVQCITNFVTVNDCANILLASGASPTMAHDIREAAEAVTGADALVCNMGAIEDTDAMILAGNQADNLFSSCLTAWDVARALAPAASLIAIPAAGLPL